jgi:hypothetical protein
LTATPHLVVDISAHGFGHIALTGPVLNCLTASLPRVTLTVRSAAPVAKLREHIRSPFRHIAAGFDIGMRMRDALTVDADASLAWYRALHSDWARAVDREAAALSALAPDAVLANVPYLSLAAAARAGVPAAALCCLNWGDILAHYCGHQPGAAAIVDQIHEAYASARHFIQPAPSRPMTRLPNARGVAPLGRRGLRDPAALRAALGARTAERVALLSLGGIGFPLDVGAWPRLAGWTVVAGMPVRGSHPDVVPLEALGLPYIEVFAAADAVITKLGYGTVAEAGLNCIPVLYVPRDGWPEEPHLEQWLSEHGRCSRMPASTLASGRFVAELDRLVGKPAPPPPPEDGAAGAAMLIRSLLPLEG